MNQTDELATKRVFGVIAFLITDYLFSCRFNSFLSSYMFILNYCRSSTGVDNIDFAKSNNNYIFILSATPTLCQLDNSLAAACALLELSFG